MTERPRRVLTIAGSDPSGGAGIQADLRVFAALGVAGLSAVTALTVQNSLGVLAVHPVSGIVLQEQILAILQDGAVDAVKIGMLAGADQVTAVARALLAFGPPNVILDPVLSSTGGVPLLDEDGRERLLRDLLPLCDLVTPNIPELEALAGTPTGEGPLRLQAARELLEQGARAVLIKGGHLPVEPVDVLIRPGDSFDQIPHRVGIHFHGSRVYTSHTHGTGCFLSSAIAAHLARGASLFEAIAGAKQLLTTALQNPVVSGNGRGYPDVFAAARLAGNMDAAVRSERHADRVRRLAGQLYVITDSTLRPDRSVEEIVQQAMRGGAKVIQLREKGLATPHLIALARRLVSLAHEADALLIVNDRVDVALAADADGVHLGPDDMHPSDALRIMGPDRLIGVSTGTVEEAKALAPYASYLGVGAIFGSQTKLDAGDPVGLKRIQEIRTAHGNREIPIVAIGGITAGNIDKVARAGADAAAVVSAVICAPDMRAAAAELVERFKKGLV